MAITYSKGSYHIDTAVILSNQNLDPFILQLKTTTLIEKEDFAEMPKPVLRFLRSFDNEFFIANPGEVWQRGCMPPLEIDSQATKTEYDAETGDSVTNIRFVSKKYAMRQMQYLGINDSLVLLVYLSGGYGVMSHTFMAKYKGKRVVDFWKGSGPSEGEFENKNDIIKYLEENKDSHWGLNTNVLWF